MRWDPKSFQRFSIATKIPVEIFCVSGPLVFVTSIIYLIMAGLLMLDTSTSSVFFLSTSWSAIMIDMSFVCYNQVLNEILANRVDIILHLVNFFTVGYSYHQLKFFPITFVICGLTFWGTVVLIRIYSRMRNGETMHSIVGTNRPQSPYLI